MDLAAERRLVRKYLARPSCERIQISRGAICAESPGGTHHYTWEHSRCYVLSLPHPWYGSISRFAWISMLIAYRLSSLQLLGPAVILTAIT